MQARMKPSRRAGATIQERKRLILFPTAQKPAHRAVMLRLLRNRSNL